VQYCTPPVQADPKHDDNVMMLIACFAVSSGPDVMSAKVLAAEAIVAADFKLELRDVMPQEMSS
jgi:hypothetical protein